MKGALIRGALVFAAGAGCATVVAQVTDWPPPPTTVEAFQERAAKLLPRIAELGYYVQTSQYGRTGIEGDPVACGPRPPQPKLPAGAVDPRLLEKGLAALSNINVGFIVRDGSPVYLAKCQPNPGE
jgi:hypothetical protein